MLTWHILLQVQDNSTLFSNYCYFFPLFIHSSLPWCLQCVSSGESSKTAQSVNSSRNNKKGFQEKGTIRTLVKICWSPFLLAIGRKRKKRNSRKTLVLHSWTFEVTGSQKKKDQTHIRDRKSDISDIRGKTDVKKLCVFSGNSHFRPGLAQTGEA